MTRSMSLVSAGPYLCSLVAERRPVVSVKVPARLPASPFLSEISQHLNISSSEKHLEQRHSLCTGHQFATSGVVYAPRTPRGSDWKSWESEPFMPRGRLGELAW